MAQKAVFLSLFVLFVVNQVSTHKCYSCYSGLDKDCLSNPKQAKFELDCWWFNSTAFNSMEPSSPLSVAFADFYESEPRAVKFQCATVLYTNLTSTEASLARGCAPKHINNESIKIINLTGAGLQVDAILRCNDALCNSK